jgi:Mn2+/Fe2+ NRAMP family transporter
LLWVALLVAPLLGTVQAIAAQVGVVARNDLQTLTLRRYGRWVATLLWVSVVAVNVVTIAADLQAGAAGIGLLAGVEERWVVVPLSLALVGLLLVGKYDDLVTVLRVVLVGFVAFVAAAFLAHPDWSDVLRNSLVPGLSLRRDNLVGAMALLGTTLTSYVYVWETIERGVEDPRETRQPGQVLARARVGAVVGALFTGLIFWSMLVACGATLGQHHYTISTAEQAAGVLRPLAGSVAADLFAVGLVVSAVVALPVLMATTAHVVGAQFDWRRGLSEDVAHARSFYGILSVSIALAAAVALVGVSVLSMLVAASSIGGFGTPIGLVLLVRLARDPEVMADQRISPRLAAAGWAVTVLVGGLGLLFVMGAALGTW